MTVALYGIPIGSGIAIGRARVLRQSMEEVPHFSLMDADIPDEIARFDNAIKETRRGLEQLRGELPSNAPTELGAFISLHLMLISDASLARDPIDIIREQKINAEWALHRQAEFLISQFDAIDDEYLRSRKQDTLQVIERIFKNLRGKTSDLPDNLELFDDTILIASDLSPADTVYFKDNRIGAFVTDLGGPTSHTAILGRSLDMPSVIALHSACRLVQDDEWVIVDGIDGVLIVNPDDSILEEYRERARAYKTRKRRLNKLKTAAVTTRDGIDIEILGNIETVDDMAAVNKMGADGVGLFRSEFLFLNRDTPPDEEEQYQVYGKIIKKAAGKPVTIRTVDLRADKSPRWLGITNAPNPSLGLTGIRLSLAEPMIFRTQLRAILRAATLGPVRIMWPMISSLSEIKQCLVHLNAAKEYLNEHQIEFNPNIECGIMIEVPAAALTVQTLIKYVDFVSVGTNDLIQYTLAADRNDEQVSYLYQPTHPAILKLLLHIFRTMQKTNKPFCICGEMAGDVKLVRLLLAMGLRSFSMHPSSMLAVKEIILSSHIERLEAKLLKILRNEDPDRSADLINKLNLED